MTYQADCTLPEGILEMITTVGLDSLPELIRILVNKEMKLKREQAEIYLKKIVTKYASSASDLANWLEVSIPEGLTIFDLPADH